MDQNLPAFVFSSLAPPASSLFQKEKGGSVHSRLELKSVSQGTKKDVLLSSGQLLFEDISKGLI